MPIVGKLLRRFRAGAHRSPLAAPQYAGADTIDITSSAFGDGGPIPTAVIVAACLAAALLVVGLITAAVAKYSKGIK